MRYEDASQMGSGQVDARNDADHLAARDYGPATGNVISGIGTITGSAGLDIAGAGSGRITAIDGAGGSDSSFSAGKLSVEGQYGTLTMDARGNYSYERDPGTPSGVSDIFHYTLSTKDGATDNARLVINIGDLPKLATDATRVVPGADGVVTLPPGVELSDIRVVGRDLVVTLPDGSTMIIVDGAIFVPQLVLGGVEVPASNLAALLIGSEPQPAAGDLTGNQQSSGGNFEVPVAPLDPGVPLGDLLPPTELYYTPPEVEELYDILEDNDPPFIGTSSVNVSEEGVVSVSAPIPDSTGSPDTTNSPTNGGVIPVSDPDGDPVSVILGTPSVSLTSAGVAITWSVSPDGHTLTGSAGANTVITLVINDAGSYTVTLLRPVDHPTGGGEQGTSFVVPVSVSDGEDITTGGTITVTIEDDSPTIEGRVAEPILIVDDTTFNINDTDAVSGAFAVSYGADGPAASNPISYAMGFNAGATGLFDTASGAQVVLTLESGVVVGRAGAGGPIVFTVSVDGSGNVTLDQQRAVVHNDPADPVETGGSAATLAADNLVTVSIVATDRDGDQASLTVNIGQNLHFEDDGPTALQAQLIGTVDEDGIVETVGDDGDGVAGGPPGAGSFADVPGEIVSATGNVGALFASGNDLPLTYSLSNNFAGLEAQGLTSQGVPLSYSVSLVAGVHTLTASAPGGNIIFTFALNASTGAYNFTLVDQLDHPTLDDLPGDNLENDLSIQLGSIIQATDGDGDSVTALVGENAGLVITVDDDTPVAVVDNPTLSIDNENFTIEGIVAAWKDWDLDPDADPTQSDQDGDGAIDELRWGTPSGDTAPSGYGFVDNPDLAIATVLGNTPFSLGTFTHFNNPINGPELDYVTLEVNFVANLNGTLVPVGPINLLFEHEETSNDGTPEQNRDIIQVTLGTTTIMLGGIEYQVEVLGLVDEMGNVVDTVRTFEGQANSYELMVRFVPTSALDLTGNVLLNDSSGADEPIGVTGATGFDGSADAMADVDGNFLVQGQYGTLTINEDGSYSYTLTADPGDVPPGTIEHFTYSIADFDGDGTTAELNITIDVDQAPIPQAEQLRADDDALAGGNAASVVGDLDANAGDANAGNPGDTEAIFRGQLTATGGDGATTFSMAHLHGTSVTVGTESVDLSWSAGTLTATGPRGVLFTVTVNSTTGEYVFTQVDNVLHAAGGNENDFVLSLSYGATDSDADTTFGDFDITFDDDAPSVSISSLSEPQLTVDDSTLGTNASASFAGLFVANFGADGPGSPASAYALGVSAPGGVNSGLVDSLSGHSVFLFLEGGQVVGREGTNAGNAIGGDIVFTVSVDSAGVVTLDQQRAVIHDDPSDPDEASSPATLSADNLVTLTATITDGDGDTATATVNIGQDLAFRDDGPSVSIEASEEPQLIVDETNLPANIGPASFIDSFNINFGADGPAAANSQSFSLSVTAGPSGLVDTATGHQVFLFLEAGQAVGREGTSALDAATGDIVFTVSVNAAGNVSLNQQRAVVHGDPTDPDEADTPAQLSADDLIRLNIVVADADGDTASASINIARNLEFQDDGPSIIASGAEPTLTVDDTTLGTNASSSFAGAFIPNFGNDGQGSPPIAYALGVSAPGGVNSGVIDVATGNSVFLFLEGGQVIGREGTSAGDAVGGDIVFTVSVNGSGLVTLDQVRAVQHNDPADPVESGGSAATLIADNLITLTATIEDGDGDTATAMIGIGQNLRFEDDGPTATNDVDSIEGGAGPATGNVLTGVEGLFGPDVNATDGVADSVGNDTPGTITRIQSNNNGNVDTTFTAGNLVVIGQYGTLTINQNGSYSYTRTDLDAGGVNDVFTYTLADGDGDTTTATLTIGIQDNFPLLPDPALVRLDDDALGGNAGGIDDDVNSAGLPGQLAGSGGDGDLDYNFTGLNTLPVGFTIDPASTASTVLINQGGTLVLTVTLNNDTGAFNVVQNNPIDHLAGDNENNYVFSVGVEVEDSDGDVEPATITINVDDDTPTVSASTTQPELTTDDSTLGTNASASFAGVFTTSFGADGAAAVNPTTYALGVSAPGGVNSGIIDVATGNAVFLFLEGGVVRGREGTSAGDAVGGDVVFTVSVNSSGVVTLDQQRAVQHNDPADPIESGGSAAGLSLDNLVTLTATVTDGDGDTASAAANIGSNLHFEDDGPSVSISSLSEPQLTVDDTTLGTDASASFAGLFVPAFGADGAGPGGGISYALAITAGPSGIVDVATGQAVNLVMNGAVVEGRTAGSNVLVFTVSVDGSGVVTLDQIRAVQHNDPADPVENGPSTADLSLDTLVRLTATVTDGDGDTASATVNIGSNLHFEDDGPSVSISSLSEPQMTVDDTTLGTDASASFAGLFVPAFGADGAGPGGGISYALAITAGPSGIVDVATGQAVNLVMNGAVVEGRTAGSNVLVFTVSVDGSGVVTLDQIRAVQHNDPADPVENGPSTADLSLDTLVRLTATVTDGDGDTASATVNIGSNLHFEDDGPTALAVKLTGTVDEDGIVENYPVPNATRGDGVAGGPAGAGSFADVPGEIVTAAGNVGALFASGNDQPLTYSLTNDFSGLTSQGLTSGGVPLSYSVGFAAGVHTLTASAPGGNTVFTFTVDALTGAYNFTLVDQLDHPTLNGQPGDDLENDLAIQLGSIIRATDADGDSVTALVGENAGLVITVDDDTPVAVTDTPTLTIELENFEVENIVAKWKDWDLDPDAVPTQTDVDGDGAIDEIRWGTPSGSEKSGYGFVDNADLAIETVLSNTPFSLGTFTHYNNPISGPELDYVTLEVNFVANFNGTLINVGPINVYFEHNETDNDGTPEQNRDIIDITLSTTTIILDGVEYDVEIVGLVDEQGDVVSQVRTFEGQANSYELIVRFVPTATLELNGNVLLNDSSGADESIEVTGATGFAGSSDIIPDGSGNFVVQGQFGTLTINENGSYNYTLTANPAVVPPGTVEHFTYSIGDFDGDGTTAALDITIEPDLAPIVTDAAAKSDDDALGGNAASVTGDIDANAGDANAGNPGDTEAIFHGQLNASGGDGALTYSMAHLHGTSAMVGTELVNFTWSGNTLTAAGGRGTLFTVAINPTTGTFVLTQVDNVLHAAGGNENDVLLNLSYRVTDSDGDAVFGDLNITFNDDMPSAFTPQDAVVSNGAGSPVVFGLDFAPGDGNINNNVGADGPGVIRFPANLDGSASGLTSGGDPIVYDVSPNGLVLSGMVGVTTIFTVTLNQGASTYSVDMNGTVDSLTQIDFNDGSYNFSGGNEPWNAFNTLANDNSSDLLITPFTSAGAPSGTINSNDNKFGISGGNSVGSGESFHLDFVTDLTGNNAGGDYDTLASRDHAFEGHYTTNGASALMSQTSNSTVKISAFDDPGGNNVVGDGVLDTITSIAISYGASPATLITANGVYLVGGQSYTVTFNGDGTVTVAGVVGDSGSSQVGTRVAAYTDNGYNSLSFTHAGGGTFKVGDFGAAIQSTDPVEFSIPVELVDADGDVVSSNIDITLNPPAPPLVLDMDGDGVEFVDRSAGVAFDYGNGAVATAWAGADDAILVRDANGDGIVTDASEFVFGGNGVTDMEALHAQYGEQLDASDADFVMFAVWNDANSNGVVDGNEMQSLAEAGIASIGLVSDGVAYSAANGDVEVAGTATFTRTDGSTGDVADAIFATGGRSMMETQRVAANSNNVVLAAAVAAAGLAVSAPAAAAVDGAELATGPITNAAVTAEAFDMSILGLATETAMPALMGEMRDSFGTVEMPSQSAPSRDLGTAIGELGSGHFDSMAPTALLQGSDMIPGQVAMPMLASNVAMPSAEALAAMAGLGNVQSAVTVETIVADALQGGGGPDINALLNALPTEGIAGSAGTDSLASLGSGFVPSWDTGSGGGFTFAGTNVMLSEALVLHHDAIQPVANG